MANRLVTLVLLVAALGACGKQIGDACNFGQDCSPNGDRSCDPNPTSPGGYCTVIGCDYSTCPGEAVCVQFYTGTFSNRPCDGTLENDECQSGREAVPAVPEMNGMPATPEIPGYAGSLDEVCALSGYCVARSSEVRYCMLKCDSDGDCRDGYECRDIERMKEHGGQPVLAPGVEITESSPKFCAARPPG